MRILIGSGWYRGYLSSGCGGESYKRGINIRHTYIRRIYIYRYIVTATALIRGSKSLCNCFKSAALSPLYTPPVKGPLPLILCPSISLRKRAFSPIVSVCSAVERL